MAKYKDYILHLVQDDLKQTVSPFISKDAVLQDLFCTLLHELMSTKIRVHEIELGKEVVA